MREGWTYKKLWEILIFDKRFNGVPKDKQKKVASFAHISANKLKELKVDNGNVRLISTGLFDGYTTEDLAGDCLNSGEIITIPTGGVANIKYYNGLFVDSGNIIGIAGIKDLKMKFVYYFLLRNKEQVDSYFRGVSIKHPYMPDICEMSLPLPPITEQERVVTELDLLSAIIEKKKEQLKAYDQLAQSIFHTMFGDPIDNPKGWETKKLRDVCHHITDGDHMPPPKSDNGIPFLTISNVNKDKQELDFSNTFFVPQEYYDNLKDERKARINDMLYTVTGSYGIPVIVRTSRPFCFQRHIALLKPIQEKVLTSFLFYWALCPSTKEEADSVATGIAQKTVGLNSLRQFNVILPPLSLQQEFAEKVEAIERQKALVQQSIEETQTMFDYTMDKYFG